MRLDHLLSKEEEVRKMLSIVELSVKEVLFVELKEQLSF